MIILNLQFNKEENRQELALYDQKTNKASYIYINPKINDEDNLKALVKWLNYCFKEIKEIDQETPSPR